MWQRLRLRRLQLTAAFLAVLVILSTVIGATGLGSRSSAPTRPGGLAAAGRALERSLAARGARTRATLPGRPPQRIRPDALTYDSVSSAIRSALER